MKRRSGSIENKKGGSRNKPYGRRHGQVLLPIGFLVLLVLIWQGIVQLSKIQEFILPSPVRVIQELLSNWDLMMSHAFITLLEALIGLAASIILGGGFGLMMGFFEPLKKVLYPLFVISQTVPLFVLAPLFIIWFGFGLLPKIVVVFIVCFFPIAVTFAQGLVLVDSGMDDLLSVMGASRWKTYKTVKIPQALPHFFSGLKISATYSIMGAVIAEWVGAEKGLGLFLTRAMKNFKTGALFADVLVIVVLSLILYRIVESIEKIVCKNITKGGIV